MPTNVKPPLFPEGAAFPIPTTAVQRNEGAPKFLFSTLLSDASVTSPSIGPAGTVTGTITYNANGADFDANGKYFDWPWVPGNAGTEEVTQKPHFNSSSTTDAFILCSDNPAHTRVLMLYASSTELTAGRAGALAVTSGLSFSADDDITWRLLWDSAGIEGGANIHELYKNGSLVATNGTALPSVTQTAARVGNNASNTLVANAVCMNYSIWNEAVRP